MARLTSVRVAEPAGPAVMARRVSGTHSVPRPHVVAATRHRTGGAGLASPSGVVVVAP